MSWGPPQNVYWWVCFPEKVDLKLKIGRVAEFISTREEDNPRCKTEIECTHVAFWEFLNNFVKSEFKNKKKNEHRARCGWEKNVGMKDLVNHVLEFFLNSGENG
jgi:hypothetical protein